MTDKMEGSRTEIKEFLNSRFSIEPNNIELYNEAFTHSTCEYLNNQRLAFLGDRVYDLVVAQLLLTKSPDFGKGALAREIRKIHDKPFQARIAREIGLIGPMVFGDTYRSTEKTELEKSDGIMEEALEALFAAIYLDQGLDMARKVAAEILFR